MASRSPHVDSSVNERRLRPIYDCLDNGNNKKALQEAEKLLRKQKDFPCAKVLKALALLRLGKQEDAGAVLKEVHEEAPTDDPTLQAMTICYRELQKPELIADVYAAAVKKESQNEELMTHLFMAYVRLNDYKRQQQIAMNLYKLKPKNPYYFWAVMSIVMQAYKADEKLSSTMLLPLAQRMTEKFIADGKIDAEAEVELYLMILELQNKYDEALTVFDGPLGERLSSYLNYHEERRVSLITKLERWSEANAVYKKLILENPDQWSYYLEYFRTGFKMQDESWQPSEENFATVPDHTSEMMAEFILARVHEEERKTSHFLRGPLLARMELVKQLRERSSTVEELGKLSDLIIKYYEKFGDRGCCVEDIRNYLTALDNEEKQTVLAGLEFYLHVILENIFGSSNAYNEKDLQRHISYLQLCERVGKHNSLSVQEKINEAVQLLDYYNAPDKFGKDLLSTDYNAVDLGYIHASHLLIKAWMESGDFNFIWKPIMVLEIGLKRSPSNHQIKLLLIKLYNKLGAVGASFALYESLDVKHVQQDSLGYLVTRHLAAKGHFSQACTVYSNTLKFFMTNYKDTTDYLISSYKFGSFTKIYEFVKFRERLNNSLQYASVTVERMILDLVLETSSHDVVEQILCFMDVDPEKDKTAWDSLRDNRDFSVMINWDPPTGRETEHCKTSFTDEVEWLKLRNLIVRSLSAAYLLSQNAEYGEKTSNNDVRNGEKRNLVDVVRDLLDQFKSCFEVLNARSQRKDCTYAIQGPEFSRLQYYQKGCYLNVFIELLELVLYLNSLVEKGLSDKEDNPHENSMKGNIVNLFQESIKRQNENMNVPDALSFEHYEEVLETLANLAEMLGFAAILCGVCQRILKPIKTALTKKKKKRKENIPTQLPQTLINFNELVNGMETVASSLEDCIHLMQTVQFSSAFSDLTLNDQIMPLQDQTVLSDVQCKVEKSYEQSLKELEELTKHKVTYFASLQL